MVLNKLFPDLSRYLLHLISIAIPLMYSAQSFSYAQFIGHGYTSCLNCHFNPFGGGALNDYGRVVSTSLASRDLYSDETSEEEISYLSGFLGRPPKQKWLRTQINYRGFYISQNAENKNLQENKWLNMQADARAVLKFGEQDKLTIVGNIGYSPIAEQVSSDVEDSTWRSREYYIGYRFNESIGMYVGLMDKVYGIKVIEHIAYSRLMPQVAQNDQTHGVAFHYLANQWEVGAHAFAGNLQQEKDLQMQGFSTSIERTIFDRHSIGFSLMSSKNNYLSNLSYSVHSKMNLKDGAAILAEAGQTTKTPENGAQAKTSRYALLQTYLRPRRGLYTLANIEYANNDTEQKDFTVRWGPGIQYFPIQRLELRFDFYNTRSFSDESSTKDVWMYLLQTHLWL